MRFDRAVDVFAAGCVLAEICLNRPLFPDGIASDREHVALVEKICGWFSRDFAVRFEAFRPGIFKIRGDTAFVEFPGSDFTYGGYAEALQRLHRAKPIRVSMRLFHISWLSSG